MSGYCLKQEIQSAAVEVIIGVGDKDTEIRMTSYAQRSNGYPNRSPPNSRLNGSTTHSFEKERQASLIPSGKSSRLGPRTSTTPPKGITSSGETLQDGKTRKNSIPRSFLNYQNQPQNQPTPPTTQQPAWNASLSHVRMMVHDSPLYARKPNVTSKPRGFFTENDPLPLQKSSAALQSNGNTPTRLPRRSPAKSTSSTSTLSVDSTTSTSTTGQTTPPSSLPLPEDDDEDAPTTPKATTRKAKVDPPKTPNHLLNPDEGLSARQKVRMGLSGLLLTSEAFRNSTGINSSGRTKRDASPGRTRAQNLREAPISPTNSRTSSQGSMKVRTEALVTKLIPTKNSVHSLIGYIKELQSSEASLRTHLESIKTKAQEDLARSHGAVNKLQSSVRQVEEERDQKAQELAAKSHEIDALQAKIEALRVALEKGSKEPLGNPPSANGGIAARRSPDMDDASSSSAATRIPPDTFHAWLQAFFAQHDPERTPTADALVRRYTGREPKLLYELQQRYGNAAVAVLEDQLKLRRPPPKQVEPEMAALLEPPTPAPTPFVMTPDVFKTDVLAAKPPLAPATPQQVPAQPQQLVPPIVAVGNDFARSDEDKVLTSCIARRRSQNEADLQPTSTPAETAPTMQAKPVPIHQPSHQQQPLHFDGSLPPPVVHDHHHIDSHLVSTEPVNIYQKPRSPRSHKAPRMQHPIHDPFELSRPPSPKQATQPLPSTAPTPVVPELVSAHRGAPAWTLPPPKQLLSPPLSPPISPANINLLFLLTDLYKNHQPDKLKDVKTIAKTYAGKEGQLIRLLKSKYGALSVKKLELHLPTLVQQHGAASQLPSKGASIVWRVLVFAARAVLFVCIVSGLGLAYFGLSSHLACRDNAASSSYCQEWQTSTARFLHDPTPDTARHVLELVPASVPTMQSVGYATAANSAARSLRVLKDTVRGLRRMNAMPVPAFHGLALLDDFSRALEAMVNPRRAESRRHRDQDQQEQQRVDMWAILTLAEDEAAKQMHWIAAAT
ncbi:Aste57867_18531 [Aphanomyces stellatus]|uniref:Aste57867_18531 protein n=1 Tax=Aphanomyces stellatus TaxID=120398 RepID=A0A485LAC4_9STRA|nr:hypothetical protein As57867_018469 [Aphanomyces stellatus]VFT95267.1 Aste57867_18531 [Aphanomyces stellatus]